MKAQRTEEQAGPGAPQGGTLGLSCYDREEGHRREGPEKTESLKSV